MSLDLEKFKIQRPYLYHLTHRNNLPGILSGKQILCAEEILSASDDKDAETWIRKKRFSHLKVKLSQEEIIVRDQNPLSEKLLKRCLTGGWSVEDFIAHINKRIFMWPTVERLKRHFLRYESEKPVILRFATADILELNKGVEFCRLNSGATRANSYLGGNAPERGKETFLPHSLYAHGINSVAEVTVIKKCRLPGEFHRANSPDGPWMKV